MSMLTMIICEQEKAMLRDRRSLRLCCWFCVVVAGATALCLWGSVMNSAQAAERYQFRKKHDPNGIGKFYLGREIAAVMSFHGAIWLEREEREAEERLSTLVELLKLRPGMTVADVGAGSGVITVLMAREVGAEGKVLAIDIQKEMLDLLSDKLNRLEIHNVDLVLGTEKSPKLKPESIDLALMVDVYHEFEFPYEMTLELAKALKPGGRIALVEYRLEDPEVPIKLVHKMSETQVKKELEQPAFGLKWKETIGKLPRQHIVIFERQAVADEEKQTVGVEDK